MKFSAYVMAMTLAASAVVGCATSPTGRNQLLLFSSSQLDEMGAQAFDGMKSETPVSKQPAQNQYVQCVADALLPYVPAGVYSGDWEVVVFNDEQVNAFALPGGKIGVYTGLLNVATNEHQLAAVIGHEIGHVIAQHGNERMSQSTLIQTGSQVVNQVLASNQVPYNAEIMGALGVGLQLGVQLPFSRSHESEADVIGLQLMAKAGFDPRQSVALWRNMEAASGGDRPMEILSTHPAPDSRINNLQANMDAALADYQAAPNKPACRP
ncbi:M48 family metallopeptidase [Alteromonas lipolytica]|uniref:Zn-dependent protease n=1 Tax=Alteromonas lipolytica TaxID=1856405 RepID=A0A1E8F9S5_9ALTE|nr:M48 family metallopeptidase [Alteromonas lipolytica]OFI32667.1 Zn-dependent protease [Alteromonas lipolytica]GGF74224.1 Zn-dependent protease [Alteromonas lipolytica]